LVIFTTQHIKHALMCIHLISRGFFNNWRPN